MEPNIMALESIPTEQGFDIASIIAGGIGMFLFFLALIVFTLVVNWKFFEKAGFKGYESLIPGHNFVVMIQIAGKPISYFFLMLIPFVNIYYMIKMIHGISKSFGKGAGFTWGLVFFPIIFLPILVWGDSVYGAEEIQPEGTANITEAVAVEAAPSVVVEPILEMPIVPVAETPIVPPVMEQPQQEPPVPPSL